MLDVGGGITPASPLPYLGSAVFTLRPSCSEQESCPALVNTHAPTYKLTSLSLTAIHLYGTRPSICLSVMHSFRSQNNG